LRDVDELMADEMRRPAARADQDRLAAERDGGRAAARRRGSSTHTRSSHTNPKSPRASARSGFGIARGATGTSATPIRPISSRRLALADLSTGGADRRHVEDAHAVRSAFNAPDKRAHHLADGYEPQAQRGFTQRRHPLGQRIEGNEELRPAVP